VAKDYGMDDRGSVPIGCKRFSLFYTVHTKTGAHTFSFAMGTGGFSQDVKLTTYLHIVSKS
jgi:hypothetical protein